MPPPPLRMSGISCFWIMECCRKGGKEPKIQRTRACREGAAAFTLVEVAISLGIFAFCIIAVASLLLSGMSTERNSAEEQGAAALLASLNLGVEHSSSLGGNLYQPLHPLEAWSWDAAKTNVTNGVSGGYAYWLRVSRADGSGQIPLINVRAEVAWPAAAVTSWDSEGRPNISQGGTGSSFFFLLR
jgi:type II secretory pathway pseudopilin PulG